MLTGLDMSLNYAAAAAIPYAAGFVTWQSRRRAREAFIVVAVAALLAAPWLVKDCLWMENPLTPVFNHWIANSCVATWFENDYQSYFALYDFTSRWQIPWALPVRGNLAAVFGPMFLLAPLVFLTLRRRGAWRARFTFPLQTLRGFRLVAADAAEQDLRRAAIEESSRRGVQYALLFPEDNIATRAEMSGRRPRRCSGALPTPGGAMRYFLGVDGGQSGTEAAIGDETGRVLGTGAAGPCNHAAAAEGRAKLESAVRGSLERACAAAALPRETPLEAACFGMSGGPDDKREILAAMLPGTRISVTTDAHIALAGATESGTGIIVIAGTGSMAYGRNSGSLDARAGGWGYIFGDEGGAFDIVRQAVRAALRMEEGWGPATSLRAVLSSAIEAPGANAALHALYTPAWPRSRVASLASLVDGAATAGDSAALAILNDAAAQLAALAGSVRQQLWPRRADVEVAYAGGVFESLRVLERFRLLVELEEGVRVIAPLRSPAEGALRLAIGAHHS